MAPRASDAATLVERGLERFEQGDLAGAVAAWRAALALAPDDGAAAAYLEHVGVHAGEVSRDGAARRAPVADDEAPPPSAAAAPVGAATPRAPGAVGTGAEAYPVDPALEASVAVALARAAASGREPDEVLRALARSAAAAGERALAALAAVRVAGEASEAAADDAALEAALLGVLGEPWRPLRLAVPLGALAAARLDARSAYLASRLDGVLVLAEVLAVSGMGRRETLQRLAELALRGIVVARPARTLDAP